MGLENSEEWMNTVHHTEQVIKQARVFFDDWLDLFPTWDDFIQAVKSDRLSEFGPSRESSIQQVTDWLDLFPGWADFVQALKSESLAEFGGTGENTIQQVTDWLGGAAEALGDYDMLLCMIDENLTQQHVGPKTLFEIVAAAINEAEKMLRESNNVHEFNAGFKRSRGLPTLLQKSQCPDRDNGPNWCEEEYTKAKLAIDPSGEGLGRGFIQHFLPPHSVSSNSTLQTAIAAYYQERWREEGQKLLDESQLLLWQAKETNDKDKINTSLELEKQAQVPGYGAAMARGGIRYSFARIARLGL